MGGVGMNGRGDFPALWCKRRDELCKNKAFIVGASILPQLVLSTMKCKPGGSRRVGTENPRLNPPYRGLRYTFAGKRDPNIFFLALLFSPGGTKLRKKSLSRDVLITNKRPSGFTAPLFAPESSRELRRLEKKKSGRSSSWSSLYVFIPSPLERLCANNGLIFKFSSDVGRKKGKST